MRVLGVDPGMTRCGVGVVEGAPGRKLSLIDVSVIRTPHDDAYGSRLLTISDALAEAIARFRPDVVAIERVFSQHNVRTVMGTAQVAGLAMVAATRAGIPVAMHTPSEVKAAVTGSGVAGKTQVATMVTRLLSLLEAPKPADAADALALAICQVWRGAARTRLDDAVAAAGRTREARPPAAGRASR